MNGIIAVDKPAGITSFGVVARLRKILNTKKIGHAGTLDPMATGVLPIFIGSAARFIEFLPDTDKRYTALIKLGFTTDTLDTTGEILTKSDKRVSEELVNEAVMTFLGKSLQIPPMYSAIKKDGVKLYELARKGIETEREGREINIYSLKVFDFDEQRQEFSLDVSCSKGTYIRSLADDIGKKLGTGACLGGLRRTQAAGFKLSRCYTLEEIEEYAAENRLEKRLIPIADALSFYPAVTVTPKQAVRFRNGGELDLIRLKGKSFPDGIYRLFDDEDSFLGVGKADNEKGIMKAEKIFVK